MGNFLSRIVIILVFSIVSLGFISPSQATLFITDLRSDWLPGAEFTAVRTEVDVDNDGSVDHVQEIPVFTIDDTVSGIRIGEFDVPNGVHRVVASLIRPDASVLDSRALIASVSGPLGTIILIPRSGDPQPVCDPSIGTVIAERDQCVGTDLPACEVERDEFQVCVDTTLPACQGELDVCQPDLALCLMDKDACDDGLNMCNDRLETFESDDDGDGVIAALDLCSSTASGSEVDNRGCSQSEYCSTILISTSSDKKLCKRGDWKGDEPGSVNPGDCMVGSGDLCVSDE